MKYAFLAAILTLALSALLLADDTHATAPRTRTGFELHDRDAALEIHLDGRPIATYLKKHPELTRPSIVNVRTTSGVPVTRPLPEQGSTSDAEEQAAPDDLDHRIMHPGIWLSFGDLSGNDYWRLKARVEFDRYVEKPQADENRASFTTQYRLRSEDGSKTICTQTTRYELRRIDAGVLLTIDATFTSEDEDFYFGDQEESGLGIRIASPLRVKGGNGSILNDRGEANEGEIWGKEAKWIDFSGSIDGRRVGLMLIPSVHNPRRSWIHARDYGVVVANPFPRQPQERRDPYVKTWVKQGEKYNLAYDILIYDRPANRATDPTKIYDEVVERLEPGMPLK